MVVKIYRYIKLKGITYDLSKIKESDEYLFLNYCRMNGRNYGFWNNLCLILSYVNGNDDYFRAYNYFANKHNQELNNRTNEILLQCTKNGN